MTALSFIVRPSRERFLAFYRSRAGAQTEPSQNTEIRRDVTAISSGNAEDSGEAAARSYFTVIASEAKQSRRQQENKKEWIASLRSQ
jgi:hypothetical protein